MTAGTVKPLASDGFLGHPASGFPYSVAELKRSQLKGPLYYFLRRYATRDVVTRFDDFNALVLDSNWWTVANGGGAAVASFAVNTQLNGAIRGTTGTANGVTASASLIGPIIYPGYANPGMEIRFKAVTAITAEKVEVGFIDAVPGSNTAGINNMDTPTAYFADGAVIGIHTAATANKLNLVTKGSATNQAIKRTASTVVIPAAGTWQTIRIQMYSQELNVADNTNVAAWIDGNLVATHDVSATAGVGAVKGSVLLAPWVYIQATDANSKSLDVDYIAVWADRI